MTVAYVISTATLAAAVLLTLLMVAAELLDR